MTLSLHAGEFERVWGVWQGGGIMGVHGCHTLWGENSSECGKEIISSGGCGMTCGCNRGYKGDINIFRLSGEVKWLTWGLDRGYKHI